MAYASELVTLLAAGLFAGGAVYVAVAEHPGRTAAGIRVALAQLPGSYRRAAPLQGGSALVALIAGAVAAFASGDWIWALAGACVGSAVPLTLIVIEPVNTQLMREPHLLADGEAAALLTSWARLHALRTVLGLAGFVVAAAAAVSN
jgi:anthrone oxygenase-like protein